MSANHAPGFRDAVLLVPGFLGLGRLGRFYYFHERIAAAIRAGLEARTGRPVLVVPCYTRPVGALAARQVFLLDQLTRVCEQVPTIERLHLVGHSAGGVDAQLLACDRPIATESWDPLPARAKVASVVGISAPYHGTYLTQAAAVRVLWGEAGWRGALGLAGLFARLGLLLPQQPALPDVLAGARNQAPEAIAFLWQFLRHRELLRDLDPEVMAGLRARLRPDPRVRLTSFVTLARLSDDAPHRPDAFFRRLYQLTAERAQASGTVPAALARLAPLAGRALDERSSDGVVNCGLQLLDPADPAELGGLVPGDHADVIGHYDRGRKPLEERTMQVGLFHSGSGFDDDAFFELYGRVVDAICKAIPDARRRPGDAPSAPARLSA
jgi:pimeloyl-ACP methyl ester carboxylesterase